MNKDIFLTNSLGNKKEKFVPINKNKIGMYVCGPTVYDDPHIGNARPLVVFDILFRVLKCNFGDKQVNYVRNITDIEWNDISESAPAILAMISMPLTYSISNGIALAFVSYALIKIFTGKFSSTSPAIWVVAILSVVSFAVA